MLLLWMADLILSILDSVCFLNCLKIFLPIFFRSNNLHTEDGYQAMLTNLQFFLCWLHFKVIALRRLITECGILLRGYILWKGYWAKRLKLICAQLLSYVQLFATTWTIAHQVPLSMGFSRQEYWSELPFPTPISNFPKGSFLEKELLDKALWKLTKA